MDYVKNHLKLFISILTSLIICTIFIFTSSYVYAYKDSSVTNKGYSSVVTDLKVLKLYDINNVSNNKNTFLSLSQQYNDANELKTFIYLNYIGSIDDKLSVNLTETFDDSLYKDYSLTLVSHDTDTNFKKYELSNSELENEMLSTRRFNVKSISKDSIPLIDSIDKEFYFNGTNNKNIECYTQHQEVVVIKDLAVSFVCRGDTADLDYLFKDIVAMGWDRNYTDSWFVFFNTDIKIDELKSVKLTYQQYDYKITNGFENGKSNMDSDFAFTKDYCDNRVKNPYWSNCSLIGGCKTESYINYKEPITRLIEQGSTKVPNYDYGWFNKYKVEYDTVDNLLDMKKLNEQNSSKFLLSKFAKDYDWGVHFADTIKTTTLDKNTIHNDNKHGYISGSGFFNTAILELTFMKGAKQYSLLAVSDIVNDFIGVSKPNEEKNFFQQIIEMLTFIITLIIICVGISILGPFLTPIITFLMSLIGKIIVLIVKGLVYILCMPFKLIMWVFK